MPRLKLNTALMYQPPASGQLDKPHSCVVLGRWTQLEHWVRKAASFTALGCRCFLSSLLSQTKKMCVSDASDIRYHPF
jgi:hypothetical protein